MGGERSLWGFPGGRVENLRGRLKRFLARFENSPAGLENSRTSPEKSSARLEGSAKARDNSLVLLEILTKKTRGPFRPREGGTPPWDGRSTTTNRGGTTRDRGVRDLGIALWLTRSVPSGGWGIIARSSRFIAVVLAVTLATADSFCLLSARQVLLGPRVLLLPNAATTPATI